LRIHNQVSGSRALALLACGICIWPFFLSAAIALAQDVFPHPALPTLTQANQVRHLTTDQAVQGYPVRIRGVVTDDVPSPDFFVQDSTAGVYVEGNKTKLFPHLLGDIVEVEGVTGPGKFAPVIRELSLHVIGKGTLPTARLYTFPEIANGELDSQRVQIRGIVRSAFVDRTSWHELTLAMNVASGGGHFRVRVPIDHEQDVSSWTDSEVLLEGVCGSLFNSERQLAGVLLYVPRLSFIKVEAAAKEVPVSALLRFSPDQGAGHRVRVRGVVAYQQPGSALFLSSAGKGLQVRTDQDTHVAPGDVVEVLGFPAVGESAPVLEDAVFRRVGHDEQPSPVELNLDVPWEKYDGAFVSTNARIVDHEERTDDTTTLLLQAPKGPLFNATFYGHDISHRLLTIPINSEVKLQGICLVRSGGLWELPESFRLLVRSPNDVVVLKAPSWWNLRHTLELLGITLAALLVLMLWVVVLGRRLRDQMEMMRQRLRSGAVLEERNRIARELHDTLEQELAGITMQLDLAVDCFQQAPQVAENAMEAARRMTRHSMREARRSVWDLRCHLLENGDLESALRQAVEPLKAGNTIAIEVRVSGQPARMAVPVEMNLLRIGQEAATNAVKHARASHITLDLQYAPEKVCLSITDDGCGFSLKESAFSGNGHFGLLDMRERAQSLGADLQIETKPGGGTRVEVEVGAGSKETKRAESKAHSYSGR